MKSPNETNANSKPGMGGWVLGALAALLAVFALLSVRSPKIETAPSPSPHSGPATVEVGATGMPQAVAETHPDLPQGKPIEVADQGYVGSSRCQSCHQREHDTWHQSYHRTMTQKATPESVIGEFNVTLQHGAKNAPVRLSREQEAYWMEIVGQEMRDESGAVRPVRFPIEMTTGSHHMQVYWAPIGRDRSVVNVPFVYLRAGREWIPWGSCFLQPPNEEPAYYPTTWNKDCVHCHTTHGQPRESSRPGAFDTVAAEFGISCEACHGPGEKHVAYRETNRDAPAGRDPIVNPASLDHRTSSQVCGACHSFNTERIHVARPEFRPGQDLLAMRQVIRFDAAAQAEIRAMTEDKALAEQAISKISHMFWPDGIARVTGREYTGMMDSSCHVNGTMSCLSCHQMHQSKSDPRSASEWADDQLDQRRLGNAACTQCHEPEKFSTRAHTHHEAASTGSECMNCHMPHTSWGLLRGLRSHRVNSPDLSRDRTAGRPNACNLCHLDKTIEWSADHMADWYGAKKPSLSDDEKSVAAGVLWALRGDAGVRALMAWHFSWPAARQAAGSDWMPAYLALLLDDDYDAVRYVARRSLKTFEGYGELEFDFLGSREHRETVRGKVVTQWEKTHDEAVRDRNALLIDKAGRLKRAELDRMLMQRDVTPVYLIE
ncbi:MAG: C cytochrome precursor [Verrucomicrobiae bacterium]|nr:C cytochrome precursor [Verrucomicrobiae bacterium]